MRLTFLCFLWIAAAVPAASEPLARVAAVERSWLGALTVDWELPGPVAYRAAALDGPARIVIDIRTDAIADALPETPRGVLALRAGRLGGGWSRLVLDLAAPMRLDRAALSDDRLGLTFVPGPPAPPPAWTAPDTAGPAPIPAAPEGRMRVVVDPGHGGIDPGAVRAGMAEKDVVLEFARALELELEASGRYDVVLTRDADVFLPLARRVRIARAADARILLSIHANTVTRGVASGAIVYTRSDRPSDPEAAALAALENRADVRAGVVAAGIDDDVTRMLADLEDRATRARASIAGEALVAAFGRDGALATSRPLRSADFRVLRAPDFPSLLLEIGFLSNEEDRADMASAAWRRTMAGSVRDALDAWVEADRALVTLMRN